MQESIRPPAKLAHLIGYKFYDIEIETRESIIYQERRKIMLTVEKLNRCPETFRRIIGVDVELFKEMAEKILPLWNKRRDNFEDGGRNHSLYGHENHLLALLLYYRCYVTYEFFGFLFDTHETTVMRAVKRIEKIAVKVLHIEKKRDIDIDDNDFGI